VHEHNIWLISAIILGIVVVSKLLSKKTGTVDVLWLIIFGALFANIGILPEHNEVIEYIGEWGIVFIMFALGFDEDLSHFVEGLKKSIGIALIGAFFPFLAGYGTAFYFGFEHNAAMLWGLTMTATAVSLTMMSLRSEGMHKSTAATGIMTAAVIDDILSLIGVAIIIPIVMASSGITGHTLENTNSSDYIVIGKIILEVVAFFGIVLFLGLFAFPAETPKQLPEKPTFSQKFLFYFNRTFHFLGIRNLLMASKGEFTPLMMIAIAMTVGAIAEIFGFHPAIGAYLAGLFLKKEYFVFKEKEVEKNPDAHFNRSKFVIDHLAFTIFGPIFFVNLGSKIVFETDILISTLPIALTLFFMVFSLQILSAGLAARFTGGYQWHESVMIGLGMLGRAELAFIVINIAYVQSHIISTEEFYILIFTTFLLNISVPITIKLWKPFYQGKKELKILGITLSKKITLSKQD
jgi:Kef-type K+ transport system membrane component KefB